MVKWKGAAEVAMRGNIQEYHKDKYINKFYFP